MIPRAPVKSLTELYNQVWRRTIWLDACLLLIFLVFFPTSFLYLLYGMGLGVIYLWSLMSSAQHPKPKIQFVFSLTRLALLAYVMVNIAKFNIYGISVVFCGFLSYKIVLVGEYATQALAGLRWQKQHRTQQI